MPKKQKRVAAQAAENALTAQAFAGHTPQTQLKIAKTRARTAYKTCLNKANLLISENNDPDVVKKQMHVLTDILTEYITAIHTLVDVTDEDKVDALLAEIDQATDAVEALEKQVADNASIRSGSRRGTDSESGESEAAGALQQVETEERVVEALTVKDGSLVQDAPLSPRAPEFSPRSTITSHLSRIKIPKFSGEKIEYPEWRAVFDNCVDADSRLSAELKLLYLRDSLSGEAIKSISGLGYSAHAYAAAKDTLEREYGGARRLSAIRLGELEKFRPMKEPSGKEVKDFSSLLNLLVTNLREEGKDSELDENSTLYQQALKKLP